VPWFLVDDAFHHQDAVLATSMAARGLWVTAGAWSSAHHTDVVPDHVLAALGSTPELVTELVTKRLWKRVRGGYQFRQEGNCKIASQETVDNQRKMKTERQSRWRAGRRGEASTVDAPVDAVDNRKPAADSIETPGRAADSRRAVDASTDASTWYPGPDPGSNPVVDVVNRGNGSSSTRASPAVIDAIIKEIHDQTGKLIDPEWAQRIADGLLKPGVASPAAYVRQAIRNEPDPGLRFLPQYGRHARKEPQ
jgi:hypothetical protein